MNLTNSLIARGFVAGLAISFSCNTEEVPPAQSIDVDEAVTVAPAAKVDPNAVFLKFSSTEQTLPAVINKSGRKVALEVGPKTDLTRFAPMFELPEGYTVEVSGQQQVSGKSSVNFAAPVVYTFKDKDNQSTTWQVNVVPLKCRIVIDASHDGGVWWFPQWQQTGFDASKPHQGQAFANTLRDKGFEVTELGRDRELTEDMFFGNYIVIRVNGFEPYTPAELEVYGKLLQRGMNLAFFTDHKKNDPVDELGDYLKLNFEGAVTGTITNFASHPITAHLESLPYIAGSVLTNASEHPDDLVILGRLNSDPVMGVLKYPKSKVFFIGDSNGLQVQPQPFINNLIDWMGTCFEP